MKKIITQLFIFCIVLVYSNSSTRAQNYLDINNIKALINYEGSFFTNYITHTAGFEVPKSSGKNTIFTSALWIGGYDTGNNLHEAAQTYRQNGTDYWAGPLDTLTLVTDTSGWQKTWKVNRSAIENHKKNWNKGGYVIPDEIKYWPATGKGSQSKILAPFADLNSNSIYEPQNGDYPYIYGDQAVYFIFNDTFSKHQETRCTPMGIEVKGMAYAFNSVMDGDSLNNIVFLHLDIKNFSNLDYDTVFAGIWTDFDIGFAYDDFIACDSSRNMYYGYNGDLLDESVTGYGLNPPFQAVKFLNRKMSHFVYYNNDFSGTGNPFNPIHYYNFLRSKWHNGQQIKHGDTIVNFMYPGNPKKATGAWSEVSSGNTPGDRRGLASTGPFSLKSKDILTLDMAYIFVRKSTVHYLDAVDDIFTQADNIQQLYDQGKLTDPNYTSVIDNEKLQIHLKIYPNPMENYTVISFQNPYKESLELKIADMSGRIVLVKTNLSTDQVIITKNELQAGFYIVSLENERQKIQVKLIVR